jgi:hypothetical protein
MNRFQIPDDDEIKICPPNFSPQIRTPLDYHTCYDGDIQRFLTRENPQLPLCLQVAISSTFYSRLFHVKVLFAAFLKLQFGFDFLEKEYQCKSCS